MKKIIRIFVCILIIPILGSMATANVPPSAPIINGPTEGDADIIYNFTFVATHPENSDLKYFVEWDDGTNSGWTGCNHSGETIILEHKYDNPGTFTITARAQECPMGDIGPDGTHTITITKDRQCINKPFQQILQHYLNMFPILSLLLQRFRL